MKFGLIFGGASFEHEISIVSAVALKKALSQSIEHFISLDENHHFWLVDSQNLKSSFFAKGEYKTACKELFLGLGGFYYLSDFFKKKVFLAHCVFYSLIHGADGEDGHLSALLEFSGVDFIAPRIPACVLSFDKELTKIFAKSRGVKVLDYEILDSENVKNCTKFPLIIKPARLGSSIGVSVVNESSALAYALESAAEFDKKIIAESFIAGVKEYNLAGCKAGAQWILSIIEEPKAHHQKEQQNDDSKFLDFEDKYLDFSRTQRVLKAEISNELEQKLQENFKKIYENCFEGALIRCDFFVIENEVYLNEINPIPGSGANYLFENFGATLENLAQNLPRSKKIKPNYKYIHKIQAAKGKV